MGICLQLFKTIQQDGKISHEICNYFKNVLKQNFIINNYIYFIIYNKIWFDNLPIFRYPRSNMSYPTKFEKLTFFEKWTNNNVLQLCIKIL